MCNIREAHIEDAENVVNYIVKVSEETNFMMSDSTEIELDVKKEEEFLQNIQKSIITKMFLYEIDGEIVGICNLKGIDRKKVKHRVNLGISVLKKHWGDGIAKKLINYAVGYAKENSIKKIELTVRIDNERALKLYKSLGFFIEGEIKDFFCIDNVYYNCYMMGLFI
ncbi:GNAT family N-acetyltransferase [Brachyspira hyodysenteriae]|uniref:GNAT family N-acetyltransferase n=1 Tax=Brachyspira hyodysenteriae TaxID=159 RepID=UPI001182E9AA|nr:GNAT family protein [Brachyspira hyodysenteriae]TVL85413.1 acetyltransferase [Brachyspira hyodysenteriae]